MMPSPGNDVQKQARPPRAILLMGPTASGKTRLSISLAKSLKNIGLPVEIISVDSVQVYTGMDIGSAKPGLAERDGIRHHLIDICDPGQSYSAARFRVDALREIERIRSRGHVPLLVGGTMLYFRALTHGLSSMPAADESLRRRISAEADQKGWPSLHQKLALLDPRTATRLHPNDGQRIQRALEIAMSGGASMSQLHARQTPPSDTGEFLKIGIQPPERSELHRRIEHRLGEMFAQGFVEEVAALFSRGDLSEELPAVRSVGYRQIWAYLEGKCDLDHARHAALAATRQFAKRQCTWLRSEHDICWLNFDDPRVVDAARGQVEQWYRSPA